MDRVRWFFDQLVLETELNLAFDQVEEADRNLASDLGVVGIISGAVVLPHQPIADLTVDVTAPGRAYDRAGRRVYLAAPTTLDLSVDQDGTPTAVTGLGNERWLSIFLRFARVEYDPRTDGASQQVNFRQDEGATLVVRQAGENVAGTAERPTLDPNALLLCDVVRRHGQDQIVTADLDTSRRQGFVLAGADSVAVQPTAWQTIAPTAPDVQASLDAVDQILLEHVTGSTRRHRAEHVDTAPVGFLTATTVQGVVTELVTVLGSMAAGTPGASRIGADAIAGAPAAIAAGTVDSQLQQLAAHHNAHVGAAGGAHAAAAISAAPHAFVQAVTVQGQLEEVVADLASTATGTSGAARIGAAPIAGAPLALPAAPVQVALGTLLAGVNAHLAAAAAAHPAAAVTVADSGNRYVAGTVEAALDEVMRAFAADHIPPNQTTTTEGWHRAIRQPLLTLGGIPLIWESRAAGNTGVFRVYATVDGVFFTINAAQTGTEWRKDAPALPAVAMKLDQGAFQISFHTGPQSFTTWQRVWRLVLAGSGSSSWEASGQLSETGRLSCEATNTATVGRTVTMGGTVNLRSRLLNPPSSVTLVAIQTSPGFVGTPSLTHIDRDGFSFEATQFLAAGAHGRWIGRYTVAA